MGEINLKSINSPPLSEVFLEFLLKGETKLSVHSLRFTNMILSLKGNSYDPTFHLVSVKLPLNIFQRITDHRI